jgi:hypothetical protein
MTATGLGCGSCGAELQAGDKFCHECAAPVVAAATPAEYKQVTVLFADVVHSMDIAAAVGAERLREIMTDLANRCAAVVQRYGGTVHRGGLTGPQRPTLRRPRPSLAPAQRPNPRAKPPTSASPPPDNRLLRERSRGVDRGYSLEL